MKKLVVLDYSSSSVHFFDIPSDIEVDDCLVETLGFSLSNCYWMLSDHINYIFHERLS